LLAERRFITLSTVATWKRGRAPHGFQKATLGKRNDIRAGDDRVVEHPNVDRGEGLLERVGRQLVRATEVRHAGREAGYTN
jgi:hypothetical protein